MTTTASTTATARFALPDADVHLFDGWLPADEADVLFARLLREIDWQVHRIRMFGRLVDSPRLSCWIGDPQAAYVYSGTRFAPQPWPQALVPLRERLAPLLQAVAGAPPPNSVLANLYRDGKDSMGWHSDDEPELGPRPAIASISLGAPRRFLLRHRGRPELRWDAALTHGSLLLMAGETQRHYRHAVPKTARVVGPRINLTFRTILAGPEASPTGGRRDAAGCGASP